MTYDVVSAADARSLVQQGHAVLVDIRGSDEHVREHIPGSIGMPLTALSRERLANETRTIIFYCASGNRTHINAARLLQIAPGSPRILAGGLGAWRKAGGPVALDHRRPIEIMRQVQLAAGSLVVAGVVLSVTVSHWFLGLSLFVGTGLMLAGITGFCGMARLLGAMPWNRAPMPPGGALPR